MTKTCDVSQEFVIELLKIFKTVAAEDSNTFSIEFDDGTEFEITFRVYGIDERGDNNV